MRFRSRAIAWRVRVTHKEQGLADPYALARWSDHQGTRRGHQRGVVRIIRDHETWEP
jgi:hypothetical protein